MKKLLFALIVLFSACSKSNNKSPGFMATFTLWQGDILHGQYNTLVGINGQTDAGCGIAGFNPQDHLTGYTGDFYLIDMNQEAGAGQLDVAFAVPVDSMNGGFALNQPKVYSYGATGYYHNLTRYCSTFFYQAPSVSTDSSVLHVTFTRYSGGSIDGEFSFELYNAGNQIAGVIGGKFEGIPVSK